MLLSYKNNRLDFIINKFIESDEWSQSKKTINW